MKWFARLSFLLLPATTLASELTIENTEFNYVPGSGRPPYVVCTVAWKNAWHHTRNHDAVWLFVKVRSQNRSERPVLLTSGGHEAFPAGPGGAAPLRMDVSTDRRGLFALPHRPFRGDVRCRLKLVLDETSLSQIDFNDITFGTVYGIEMVYVPEGRFYEGDADTTAHREAAAYEISSKTPLPIDSEQEVRVNDRQGSLFYQADSAPQYRGDAKGPIPAAYPKGFRAFYCMKYELTQGQYAAFLNSIYEQFTNVRANNAGRNYYRHRGTIELANDRYVARKPSQPTNFVSWDDGCAFADWACLRPMSELEYVKACRGTPLPVGRDYPWGTATRNNLARFFDETGDLVWDAGLNESMLTDATKDVFGASYYWIMDLSGGYWERVVGYGHPNGRLFRGTHGDGRLSESGGATNDDWPRNETGGVGYKGGGFYEANMRAGAFVPFSPVSYRPFAAWAAGPRSNGYGFRCVRSAVASE